jgi:hypothetical protein
MLAELMVAQLADHLVALLVAKTVVQKVVHWVDMLAE